MISPNSPLGIRIMRISSKVYQCNYAIQLSTIYDITVKTSYNVNGTHVCYCVKMQKACICMSLLHSSPFVAILLLQTYGHYPSTTCFHTLSAGHLSMPNDAENIIYLMCQESNVFIARQGMPGSFLNPNQSQ